MKTINLTLDQAKQMQKSGIKELKELAEKTYPELVEKDLPTNWNRIMVNGKYINALGALDMLLQLRDIYNDGWVADWDNEEPKYIIKFLNDKINKVWFYGNNTPLAFKSTELRDKFLLHFEDLILQAKPVLE